MDEISTLISRIDLLLQSPTEGDCPDVRAHMETTLTDGYAKALALEAEHWRLQREIGAIAADLAEGRGQPNTRDLASLARRLAVSEEELAGLRDTLVSLRERIALAARAA
jgi:hypothetical protein